MPVTPPAPVVRRARLAVGALFLTNGALLANLLPRYPEVKAQLGMENSVYGLALAAFPAGAILAGLAAGALIRRIGSAALATLGTVLTATGLLAAAWAPGALWFALALLAAGAFDALTDVAQNAHGLRVQRHLGRSAINSFHALWSLGAVIGGAMAAAAIALEMPLRTHLLLSGILFSVVALLARRAALPGRDVDDVAAPAVAPMDPASTDAPAPNPVPRGGRTAAILGALVLIAIAGTLVEDAGNSWATLYLARDLGAASTIAATGFVALVGAQFVGRLLADPLVDRLGQRAVARGGGALIALGMGLALALPSVPGTIAGFALTGLGSASLVPSAMAQADALPGLRPGTGLTVVSWLMRLGFLASPPLVGLVADAFGLRAGLLSVPLAGLAVVQLAGVLPARRRSAPVPEREQSTVG
ncbi:MFS transporter [Brachybacterium sp. sponge]|uniref:MFS transporter n=1 Tax=Brachybacterium sp. sponge TaxID=1775432 RepID=UPI0007A3FAD2|nr:MFS transporter [Brachybacterium sp. sponge]